MRFVLYAFYNLQRPGGPFQRMSVLFLYLGGSDSLSMLSHPESLVYLLDGWCS